MKQQLFEQRHSAFWQAFAERLELLERHREKSDAALAGAAFPAAYRQLCRHLAIARARAYSPLLLERLNQLALRGYQQLYHTRPGRLPTMLSFIAVDFPKLVRREARLFWCCCGLFWLPLLTMGYAVYQQPALVYSLLDPVQVVELVEHYQPDAQAGDRPAASDVEMLGFYIYNNISIGFRTFAAGIIGGIGTLFILLFNGLFMGAVGGYLSSQGLGTVLFPFVVGHSAFELTGILLAGVAGLKIGLALVAPGRYSRVQALRRAAAEGVRLLYGVVALLLLAAIIEAFWSSNRALPVNLKYVVGIAGWLLLALYLLLAGRRGA
ncbi:MAG: stage II sporulation protein M [Candidatus Competibacteraceae bacterium]